MPKNTTTRLDAVNLILSSIGIAAIGSLSDESDDTSVAAEQQLDAADREAQAMGWWFNSYCRTYDATSGEVLIPSTVLYVDAINGERYTVRGGRLMDLETGLFEFTSSVSLRVVEMVPFEELPEVARGFIIAKASRRYADRQLGDSTLSRFSRADEKEAYLSLRKAHLRAGNFTIWGPTISAAMRRGGPLGTNPR